MQKIKAMFELACKEIGWNAKDWICAPECDDDAGMFNVGGAVFKKNNEDEYLVSLLRLEHTGELCVVESVVIKGANYAVCHAMKHLVYYWLLEGLPARIDEEPLDFVA